MKVGDEIHLNLVLWDGNPNKHVKAIVRSGKYEISGSPVSVPYNNNGQYFYKNDLLVVPDGANFISSEYVIFDDAGMTIESKDHERAQDIFEVQYTSGSSGIGDEISKKLNEMVNIISGNSLIGEISSDEATGYVLEECIEGVLHNNDDICGFISSGDDLKSSLSSNDTTGEISGD